MIKIPGLSQPQIRYFSSRLIIAQKKHQHAFNAAVAVAFTTICC